MNDFTPVPAFAGGVLIGVASILLFLFNGRIAGISGIVAGLVRRSSGESAWRECFVAGLISGGLLLRLLYRDAFAGSGQASLPLLGVAGLLVGLGARMAGGCTSGHGVCGTARLSARSMLVTLTFIVAGAATVFFVHRGGAS
jgi:uncharacterized membrane protein YedE/YeeE